MQQQVLSSPDIENSESQKMMVEDLDQADDTQQLQQRSNLSQKNEIGTENNLFNNAPQSQQSKQSDLNSINQGGGVTSFTATNSEKRISEDRVMAIPQPNSKVHSSNKSSFSARGSIRADLLGDFKSRQRLSKQSVSGLRQLDLTKGISANSSEEQAIFSYSNGPTRYKMKKGESVVDGTTTEFIFFKKLRKRMRSFFDNYTDKGRIRFYEKISVHRTINDKSDGYFDKKSKIPCAYLLNKLQKKVVLIYSKSFFSKIPVMSQQSTLSMLLQFLILLYNSLFFLLLSLIIVLPGVLADDVTTLFKTTLGVWIFEVCVKLNTSTHHLSKIITNRKEIFTQYFKKQLICDSCSYILLILLIFRSTLSYQLGDGWNLYTLFQILLFAKLYNTSMDLEEFQQQLCMIMKKFYIIKLINLIVKFFIIAHIIALMWYLIGQIEIYYLGLSITWQEQGILSNPTWWNLYLVTMNWSLTMMTTSQSTGTTQLQLLFSTFIMLFTTIIAGYMITVTGQILVDMDSNEDNKKNDLNIINDYMRGKKISTNLQRSVNVYLDYYYQKNYQKKQEDTKGVLSKISNELRSSIQKEYFYQIISKIDFLKYNYTVSSLQNIAIQCEEVAYYPSQVIFEENDYHDAALLIIIEGNVEIYSQVANSNEIKVITQLKEGNILGQINFFTGMARTACARSIGFTKVAKISRANFMEVIKENDKDIQTFYQMKDNILLYENYREMNIKCSACQSFDHLQGSCSLVHFNKEFAVQTAKVSNEITQRRGSNTHQRLQVKKYNSLKKLVSTQEKNIEFLQFAFLESEMYTESMNPEDYDEEEEEEDSSILHTQQDDHQIANNTHLKKIMEQEEEDDRVSNQQLISKRTGLNDGAALNTQSNSSSNQKLNSNEVNSATGNERWKIHENGMQSSIKGVINDQAILRKQSSENRKGDQNQKQNKIQSNQILPESVLPQPQAAAGGDMNKSSFSNQRQQNTFNQNRKKLLNVSTSKELHDSQDGGYTLNTPDKVQKSQAGGQRGALLFDYINEYTQQTEIDDQMSSSQLLNNSTTHQENRLEQRNNQKYQSNARDTFYWSFDRQKDYDYYFNHGNAFIKLHQHKYYQRQKELRQLVSNGLIKGALTGTQTRRSKNSKGNSFLIQKVQLLQNIGSLIGNKATK